MKTHTSSDIETSLTKVLWFKFVQFIEVTPLKTIAKFVGLSFLAGLLSSILRAPDATQTAIYQLMMWNDAIIPTILSSIGIIFYAPKAFLFLFDEFCEFAESFTGASCESGDTIEGVPVPELIDHLFEKGSFKRDDIESKFGMPRNRYQRLAEKMEALEILTRGENNSRVLNKDMTRAEVIEHLKGKRVAMQLDTLNIIRPLPHSPTFKQRSIAQTA